MTRQPLPRMSRGQPDSNVCGASLNARCLHECQQRFAAALLNPDMPIPHGLVGPDRAPSTRRFNVYRNNVAAGLVEALAAHFPAARRIVGEAFFAAMARVYVALEPPKSPAMLDYGETFPAFIDRFKPARSVPYLADIARLERAWTEAYHAAESTPIDTAQLGAIDPRCLAQIRFALHPSLRVVRSSFPSVHIWLMNIDGGMPAAIDIHRGGEHAVVLRPAADVEVIRVAAGTATFIQRIAAGASVAGAASIALDGDSGFDLAGALRDLLAMEAIVGWNVQEDMAPVPVAGYA